MAVAGIASLHAWVIRAYDTVSLTNFFAPTKNFSWREKFFSAARWRLTAAGKNDILLQNDDGDNNEDDNDDNYDDDDNVNNSDGDDVGNDNGDDDDNITNSNDNNNNDDETKQNDKNFTSRQKYFPRKSCFTPFL